MKILIVGGVAGGATAAARMRRIDESVEIILLEKGKYISYANCGLPYYIGGTIKERDKLFVQTPEVFGNRFNIDVRVEHEALSIDPQKHEVTVKKADGTHYTETYDKLLLSPGASPVRPPLKGIDHEAIFTMRNVDDTDHIKAYIDTHPVKKAVIIGAGFIGLEMAENLHQLGIHVSIVEMIDQVMAPIDFSMASLVHQELTMKGVDLYLGKGVECFEENSHQLQVCVKGGEKIDADLVILSIGVRAQTKLAQEAGLTIGEMQGIYVNDYLQTSDKDIYAVGDAIEFKHPITGKPWLNYLANPANRQARLVADNMIRGNQHTYEGAIGTSIAKVFDLTVASTGVPAKRLKQWGIDYATVTTKSGSNASYYPGAMPMTIKLTFSPKDGMLYGAQIIGCAGVDKRIDQAALIVKHQGTIYDLQQLEHAYAPPFSSAKDPLAIAGYAAGNILNGTMPPIYWRELNEAIQNGATLLDVRTKDECELGALKGSINIPLDELRNHLAEFKKETPIVVYCGIGLRAYLAQRILLGNGFTNVRNLIGGSSLYETVTADYSPKKQTTNTNSHMASTINTPNFEIKTMQIDACGLQCPGPILKVKQAADKMQAGERVEIIATDPGFARDIQAWCNTTGNRLVSQTSEKGRYSATIEKQDAQACKIMTSCDSKAKTFIMFSDDLDKALATFVLANGAAATGQKVTVFFTFWGLNVIKKQKKGRVEKDIWGKMFGFMLPAHSLKLKLSKMNMGGLGTQMMRYLMKLKNIDSLEQMRQSALDQGVEFIACQMSMDMMGVKREELMDEVTIGGVATYMERADQANINLFI